MPKSTLNLCQGRLYPPVMDFRFGLRFRICIIAFPSTLYSRISNPFPFLFFYFCVCFQYFIQHCFICCGSYSAVSEDAGIEPRAFATSALAVRRSNHSARSHPFLAKKTFRLQYTFIYVMYKLYTS
jgi:hypothetical protein